MRGFHSSEKVLVYSGDGKGKVSRELKMKDANGNILTLFLLVPENIEGTSMFYLYSKGVIINETPFDLIPWACEDKEKKKKYQVAGQLPTDNEKFNPKMLLIDDVKMLAIGRRMFKDTSGPVPLATVGNNFCGLIGDDGSYMEFGVNVEITKCEDEKFLYSKVVTIVPRYVLVNNSQSMLAFRRDFSQQKPVYLQA